MAKNRGWTLQVLLSIVFAISIFSHVGNPTDAFHNEHIECCHAGQQNCSIILASNVFSFNHHTTLTCDEELFLYQSHFDILLDPPPKYELL